MEEKVQHATLQKHSQQRAPLIGNTVNQRAISPCWHCQKTLLDRPLNSILAEGRDFFPKFVTLFIHGFSGEFLNITVVSFLLSSNEEGRSQPEFTLGGEGEVAAGPVGRTATAQTDAYMRAEILSWSRSRGVFAGISLQGATLRQDLDDNATLYGRKLENREIVTTGVPPPAGAAKLLALLNKHSERETKSGK
jgi:hypothetical protein